jgi:hypothetical protein
MSRCGIGTGRPGRLLWRTDENPGFGKAEPLKALAQRLSMLGAKAREGSPRRAALGQWSTPG